MNFPLVAISLLMILSTRECWAIQHADLWAAAPYFESMLKYFDGVFAANQLTSNYEQQYTGAYRNKLNNEGSAEFKTFTITLVNRCVDYLLPNNQQAVQNGIKDLCKKMKEDETIRSVLWRNDLQKIFVEKAKGTQRAFNQCC